MVWVRHRGDNPFNAQAYTEVRDGSFSAGPFGDRGGALQPGTYEVSVSGALAQLQPEAVQPLLGEGYSLFTGPEFVEDELGRSPAKVIELRVGQ